VGTQKPPGIIPFNPAQKIGKLCSGNGNREMAPFWEKKGTPGVNPPSKECPQTETRCETSRGAKIHSPIAIRL